ncbi:MAG TPA: hypothetical protein VGE04_19385 [Chloroflexia bacterium]|jgi:hypothetical protein
MRTAKELHDQAMELAQLAYVARGHGDLAEAQELARQALPYEQQAADTFAAESNDNLWRAVLYRSAASLAMQCEEWEEAERLIQVGLSGKPPKVIAEELRELLEEVRKQVVTQPQVNIEKQHTA